MMRRILSVLCLLALAGCNSDDTVFGYAGAVQCYHKLAKYDSTITVLKASRYCWRAGHAPT